MSGNSTYDFNNAEAASHRESVAREESSIKFRNVSNPAAFGAEWIEPDSGTTFQLVNSRATSGLFMGMKRKGGEWSSPQSVVRPERFGMHEPPKNWKDFAGIVRAFLDNAEKS